MDSLSAPTGFALPADNRHDGPNCGVTALAVVCGRPFKEIWDILALNKGGNWKGRTSVMEWFPVLDHCGVKNTLKSVLNRVTLQRWALVYAKPGVTYMVRTGGHVQVVRDGWVIDQAGAKHVTKYWGRRKRLTHTIEIH